MIEAEYCNERFVAIGKVSFPPKRMEITKSLILLKKMLRRNISVAKNQNFRNIGQFQLKHKLLDAQILICAALHAIN